MIEFFKVFKLPQASNFAAGVDSIYDFIFWLTAIGFFAVVIPMAYYAIKYRRSKSDPKNTPYIEGHTGLEMGVSLGLLVIVMVLFYWGWSEYSRMINIPADATEISVMGQQWSWEFTYANGKKDRDLIVPQGDNIKLIMSSKDVLHSFYVPQFRIKQDVIPNMYTYLWFNANQTGTFDVFCAEFCGTLHSKMLSKVKVLSKEDYEKWNAEQETAHKTEAATQQKNPVEIGKELFTSKNCMACHTVDGTPRVGPSLNALFGKMEQLEGGTTAKVDENYLRESMMNPSAKIVKGFNTATMPPYQGQLNDEEVNALVAYIKSL